MIATMRIEDLVFEEPGPKISDDDINRAEESLGVKLPIDYRSFLLSHNGGHSVYYETDDGFIGIEL